MIELPKHKCGLSIEHNMWVAYNESVSEYLSELTCPPIWESQGHQARAISTNQLWEMQWYPETSINFHKIAAPTLEELLSFSLKYEKERA